MRVLTTHRPGGAWAYITDGWINALRACGFTAERWDGRQASWDAFDPDLAIMCSGHRQPIPQRRRAKVAIHVNPYGDVSIRGIDEPQDAIRWTKAQRPDAVFGYGHATDAHLWSKWERELCPWVPMPTAGDATLFKPGQDERDIDVGYVGGYWPYKAQHIDKYLMTLIRQARQAGLRSAVYGWGGWPAEAQAGQLADEGVPRFFQRCRVCPCICEPHTAQWGIDVPERVFKVILSGAIAIHDPLSGLRRFSQHVLIAHDAPDFVRLCCDWAQPDMAAQRAELSVKQRSDVLREHTYFHRLAGLLGCVGFSAEADSMLEQAARLR